MQRRVLSAAFCPKENKAGIKGSPCSAPLGLADEVVVSVVLLPNVLGGLAVEHRRTIQQRASSGWPLARQRGRATWHLGK